MERLRRIIYQLVSSKELSAKEASKLLIQLQNVERETADGDIAIIGISGKTAKADNLDEYWDNIIEGRNCIDDMADERLDDSKVFLNHEVKEKNCYKKFGFMNEVNMFDAENFNISAIEAKAMDPYQRIMLETAFHTFSDGGYCKKNLYGTKTGVFVGRDHVASNDYGRYTDEGMMSITGSWPGIVASRISYVYNLKGPSIITDTACSSGLVSLHYACESLRNKECNMAFVGGISTINYTPIEKAGETLSAVETSEGYIRAFDKNAKGIIWGEGVGGILLKPLKQAIIDNDYIYAVIKASGVNNNGLAKGITAPNGEAQESLLKEVWKKANINPETIQYIEAHGTGTVLGDSIELNAIKRAFDEFTNKKQFCGVGSVKTNIGHTVGASGILSLIKAVLIIKNKQVPPSLNFTYPPSYINLEDSSIYITDRLFDIKQTDEPLRIGVNCFGISGTNCHVLLEEASKYIKSDSQSQYNLLVISAKSYEGLCTYIRLYYQYFTQNMNVNLTDVCYAASLLRDQQKYRISIVFQDIKDIIQQLSWLMKEEYFAKTSENIFYNFEITQENYGRNLERIVESVDQNLFSRTVNEYIDKLDIDELFNVEILRQIARDYVAGADIDWKLLYKQNRQKKPIPGNQLERKKYWPEDTSQEASEQEEFLFARKWIELENSDEKAYIESQKKENVVVIAPTDVKDELVKRLSDEIQINQLISISNTYDKNDEQADGKEKFCIHNSEAFHDAIQNYEWNKIIYMIPAVAVGEYKIEEVRSSMEKTIRVFLTFIKEFIINYKKRNVIDLCIVTTNGIKVDGIDKECNAFQNIAIDIGKSLRQESSIFQIRNIDVSNEDENFNKLVEVIKSRQINSDYSIAIRNNKCYIEMVDLIKHTRTHVLNRNIVKKNQTFIITGGLGRLGTEVGVYLNRFQKVNLILVGRDKLLDNGYWRTLSEEEKQNYHNTKLRRLYELEKVAANVEYYSADITVKEDFQEVVDNIKRDYGYVDGVIHCAGVGVGEVETDIDYRILENIWSAKLYGTVNLYTLTKEINNGFYILFSSVITVTGGRASVGYTIGNSFLDAYSEYMRSKGNKVMCINWSTWENTAEELSLKSDTQFFKILTLERVYQALDYIIENKRYKTIVGEFNSIYKKEEYSSIFPFRIADNIKEENGTKNLYDDFDFQTDGYTNTQKILSSIWGRTIGIHEISIFKTLYQMGVDSIHIIMLQKEIDKEYPGVVTTADLYEYSTIEQLAEYIDTNQTDFEQHSVIDMQCDSKQEEKEIPVTKIQEENNNNFAIVGYACKYPKSNNPEEFWENIQYGKDMIGDFPDARKSDTNLFLQSDAESNEIRYSKGGYLQHIDLFDANFFNISAKEAEFMTPDQRILLENVYEAIERSGWGGNYLSGTKVGVYIGKVNTSLADYSMLEDVTNPLKMTSSSAGVLASRIAYILNLKGPCMVVDTACSSALAALVLALQALELNQIDAAIVAGISISYLPLPNGTVLNSDDERIRPFDKDGSGIVWGEGVGTIIIEKETRAIDRKDIIHAVIKGYSMNNNGTSNGISAQNASGQEAVMVDAWERANINPETITYIETNGTGTKLGDSIEIQGLTNAFKRYTKNKQFCAIGSVKANIGHTIGSSGMAALIKMVLALEHKKLPNQINFMMPNELLQLENSPVYINDKTVEWNSNGLPRRCGISSFGLSGTNCHIVLQEAPVKKVDQDKLEKFHLFVVSAKTKTSLRKLVDEYIKYFKNPNEYNLSNICYTVSARRGHYEYRVAISFQTLSQLKDKLMLLYREIEKENVNTPLDSVYYGYHHILLGSSADNTSEHDISEEELLILNRKTEHIVKEYLSRPSQELLKEIAMAYVNGAGINWNLLYQDKNLRVVELPAYQYDSQRYWIGEDNIRVQEYNKITKENPLNSSKTEIKNVTLLGKRDGQYSTIEMQLGKIWGELMGLCEINVFETFSEQGGTSILAIGFAKKIATTFLEDFNVVKLYANPSIAKLAQYIEGELGTHNKEELDDNVDDLDELLNEFVNGNISKENVNKFIETKEW